MHEPPASRPRVLVVEDEPDTRAMTVDALGGQYDVVAVGTVAEALASARAALPAAIVLDLGLGRESGWDLVRSVPEDAALRRVPIVVLSATPPADPPPGIGPWAAYLMKPCPMARLREVLSQLSARPTASIPSACGGRAEMEAAYRLFDNDQVTFENILQSHQEATRRRIAGQPLVILAQDTTELDLTRPEQQVVGAGPLDGATRRGSLSVLRKCGGQGASPRPAASSCAASSSNFSSEPGAASMPSCGSPISRKRFGIVSTVKSLGSQSGTSRQWRGAETRASGSGRTEYAEHVVRSFAFWL